MIKPAKEMKSIAEKISRIDEIGLRIQRAAETGHHVIRIDCSEIVNFREELLKSLEKNGYSVKKDTAIKRRPSGNSYSNIVVYFIRWF